MIKYVQICFLSFLGIFSCEPAIVFEEPVPPNAKILDQLPNEFQGVFIWSLDDGVFKVSVSHIIQELYYQDIVEESELKFLKNCEIEEGGIYSYDLKKCFPIERLDDGKILVQYYEVDTLFCFDPVHSAKMKDGRLFLNYLNAQQNWIVHVISPQEDGSLEWEMLDVPEEYFIENVIDNYKERESRDGTIQRIVNPNPEQFDHIFNHRIKGEVFKIYPMNFEERPIEQVIF